MEKEKYLHDDETKLSKEDERRFALMGFVLMAFGLKSAPEIKQEAIAGGLLKDDEEWAMVKGLSVKIIEKNAQLFMAAAAAEPSKESKTFKA